MKIFLCFLRFCYTLSCHCKHSQTRHKQSRLRDQAQDFLKFHIWICKLPQIRSTHRHLLFRWIQIGLYLVSNRAQIELTNKNWHYHHHSCLKRNKINVNDNIQQDNNKNRSLMTMNLSQFWPVSLLIGLNLYTPLSFNSAVLIVSTRWWLNLSGNETPRADVEPSASEVR